jgi:hypothetical protein
MTRHVVVRFRFFRSFLVVGALANGSAMFFWFPFFSYAVVLLTLGLVAMCFSCVTCGKSPFVLIRNSLRIGSPIPERVCSRCGTDFTAVELSPTRLTIGSSNHAAASSVGEGGGR